MYQNYDVLLNIPIGFLGFLPQLLSTIIEPIFLPQWNSWDVKLASYLQGNEKWPAESY